MLTRSTLAAAGLFLSAWPLMAQDAATPPAEAPAIAETAPDTAAPGTGQPAAADEPSASVPGAPASLIAEVKTADGSSLGMVTAAPTPSGVILVSATLTGAPAGIHAIHIHETGTCTPPDFQSAGGHVAGDKDHGVMSEGGAHPGDLPNIHIPQSGDLTVEAFVSGLTPELLTDADGAAVVIHAQPDDYRGQPAGNAGDRIACGAFAAAQ